jgi:uncharacterized membrane protein YhiD involved in acid resistance
MTISTRALGVILAFVFSVFTGLLVVAMRNMEGVAVGAGFIVVVALTVALMLLGVFAAVAIANREKRKNEDIKSKREDDTYYTIGDDGELVEVEHNAIMEEDQKTAIKR